nr:MAG TPA: hypothetical protein [Caudoviricetes sp.]
MQTVKCLGVYRNLHLTVLSYWHFQVQFENLYFRIVICRVIPET